MHVKPDIFIAAKQPSEFSFTAFWKQPLSLSSSPDSHLHSTNTTHGAAGHEETLNKH